MSNKIKKAFPLSVNHWFKDLPDFIKILVGTHEFYQAVEIYYKRACWHREEADCSLCKYNRPLYENEVESFEMLVHQFLVDEDITINEFNKSFDNTYFEDFSDTFLDTEDILYA